MIDENNLPETAYTKNADWSRVPEHGRGGLLRYIEAGIPPGSFLESVICNDLMGACGKADHINQQHLHDYVAFLYRYAPRVCWKSPEAYEAWIARGGWAGVMKEADLLKSMKEAEQVKESRSSDE